MVLLHNFRSFPAWRYKQCSSTIFLFFRIINMLIIIILDHIRGIVKSLIFVYIYSSSLRAFIICYYTSQVCGDGLFPFLAHFTWSSSNHAIYAPRGFITIKTNDHFVFSASYHVAKMLKGAIKLWYWILCKWDAVLLFTASYFVANGL